MGSCCIHKGEQHSWLTWLRSRYILQNLLFFFFLGHPTAESHAFESRRLPGNSQMPEHGRGLDLPILAWASREEVLRVSSAPAANVVCYRVSGAIGSPSPSAPGAAVLQGCSASPRGEHSALSQDLVTLSKAASNELRCPKQWDIQDW